MPDLEGSTGARDLSRSVLHSLYGLLVRLSAGILGTVELGTVHGCVDVSTHQFNMSTYCPWHATASKEWQTLKCLHNDTSNRRNWWGHTLV